MPAAARLPASLVLAAVLAAALPMAPASAGQAGSIITITTPVPGEKPDTGAAGKEDAPEADGAGDAARDCVGRYHAALKRIKETEYAALSATRASASAGDPSLPGMLIFTPKPASRSRSEMSALATAAMLARSRGRPAVSADASWVEQRLRSDLSDYLGQKPTPYLCGGVPAYIATLRRFAERTGTGPQRLQALLETQREAARRSIDSAFAAMKPVPLPHFAPDDRPSEGLDGVPTGGISGLRPAAGLSRAETTTVASAASDAAPASPAAAGDPDLPPLTPRPPRSLAGPSDLVAAIDELMTAARAAGTVAPQSADGADSAGPDSSAFAGHPVLARLATARSALRSDAGEDAATGVRPVLASAFADIEALDYLESAASQAGDPRAAALDATFDAILAAQQKECTCGG